MKALRGLLHRKGGPAEKSAEKGDTSKPPLKRKYPFDLKTFHAPDESNVDVVFVHGLTGDSYATWTAQDATEPWPQNLLPSLLPKARILTFGYDAYVADWKGMVSQTRISNHAGQLVSVLSTYRENDNTNERPIIFVCHSLGGLVLEDALCNAKQRSERRINNIPRFTHGIIFLGTPHRGAGLAKWAEILAKSIGLVKQTNSEIVSVLKRDSEVLARIQDGFHTMIKSRNDERLLPPIEITCFYEQIPLPGLGLVVAQESAILPGYIPIGIHSNHMDMTKFSEAEDPGFLAVTGELIRWTREIEAAQQNICMIPPN